MDQSQNFVAQPVQPKKSKKKVVLLILLVLVLVGGLVGGAYAWQQSKVKDTQAKLDEANSKIEQLSKQEEVEVTQEVTPPPTETRTALGNYSFVAPANWQNIKKATPQNSALQSYSFEVGSNVGSSGVEITNGTISLFNLSGVNLDKGGTTLRVYNASNKTWQEAKKQSLSTYKGIIADFMGGGGYTARGDDYSYAVEYYLVKGNQVIVVQLQEAGRGTPYSFSSANSKSNTLQEEVASLLNSVK